MRNFEEVKAILASILEESDAQRAKRETGLDSCKLADLSPEGFRLETDGDLSSEHALAAAIVTLAAMDCDAIFILHLLCVCRDLPCDHYRACYARIFLQTFLSGLQAAGNPSFSEGQAGSARYVESLLALLEEAVGESERKYELRSQERNAIRVRQEGGQSLHQQTP